MFYFVFTFLIFPFAGRQREPDESADQLAGSSHCCRPSHRHWIWLYTTPFYRLSPWVGSTGTPQGKKQPNHLHWKGGLEIKIFSREPNFIFISFIKVLFMSNSTYLGSLQKFEGAAGAFKGSLGSWHPLISSPEKKLISVWICAPWNKQRQGSKFIFLLQRDQLHLKSYLKVLCVSNSTSLSCLPNSEGATRLSRIQGGPRAFRVGSWLSPFVDVKKVLRPSSNSFQLHKQYLNRLRLRLKA